MVNYHIRANVENDPLPALRGRILNYLKKEEYLVNDRQNSSIQLNKKIIDSILFAPAAMEHHSYIRISWENVSGANDPYSFSLHLEIDTAYLTKEEEQYWNAFAKSLEELIIHPAQLSTEHHKIKKSYYEKFEEGSPISFSAPLVFILVILFLIYLAIKLT